MPAEFSDLSFIRSGVSDQAELLYSQLGIGPKKMCLLNASRIF
jgi:hypothetical protein